MARFPGWFQNLIQPPGLPAVGFLQLFMLCAYLFVFLLNYSWVPLDTPLPGSLVLLSLEASAAPLGCSLWRVTGSAHAVGSTGQAWSCPPVTVLPFSQLTAVLPGQGTTPTPVHVPFGKSIFIFQCYFRMTWEMVVTFSVSVAREKEAHSERTQAEGRVLREESPTQGDVGMIRRYCCSLCVLYLCTVVGRR